MSARFNPPALAADLAARRARKVSRMGELLARRAVDLADEPEVWRVLRAAGEHNADIAEHMSAAIDRARAILQGDAAA